MMLPTIQRRTYTFCAKCLNRADLRPGAWVCNVCRLRPGGMIGCAVCGKRWPEPVSRSDSRAYVCVEDLAHTH